MSSKIYITEETARQARSNNALSALEERFVHLMRYRIRLQQTADEAKAGTLRKEVKTLVKAADIVFGPGAGTRLKKLAKETDRSNRDGGQAGTSATPTATSHSASAVLYPYGRNRGTSAYTYGRKRGTSYGAGAGTVVEELPSDLADAWKAGKADGAGAGTPLQRASAAYQKKADEEARYVGYGATTGMSSGLKLTLSSEPYTQPSTDGGQAGSSYGFTDADGIVFHVAMEPREAPLDVNWNPFDDFAVGGSYEEELQRRQGRHVSHDGPAPSRRLEGRHLAKLIAQKRGR